MSVFVFCLALVFAIFAPFPSTARSASGTFGIWRSLYSISFMLRPVNFLLFLLWDFFSFSYLSFGGWLRSSLKSSVLRKIILSGTVLLFLATVFNFFVTASLLEKYLTGGLTFLAFLSSVILLHNNKKSYHD